MPLPEHTRTRYRQHVYHFKTPWGCTVELADQRSRKLLRKTLSIVATASLLAVSIDFQPASAAVPSAPKIMTLKAGDGPGVMSLKWAAPSSDGGNPLTHYDYDYSTDGGITWSAPAYLSTPFIRSVSAILCPQVSSGCSFRCRGCWCRGLVRGSFPSAHGAPIRSAAHRGRPLNRP